MIRPQYFSRRTTSKTSAGIIPGVIGRPCPKCDAAPGSKCFRWQGADPQYRYKVTLKTFHSERKKHHA